MRFNNGQRAACHVVVCVSAELEQETAQTGDFRSLCERREAIQSGARAALFCDVGLRAEEEMHL
jgi:hypothetical protein